MSRSVNVTTAAPTMQVPHDKIAMRAYDKWCKKGRPPGGTDQQDWLEAEAELRSELNRSPAQPAAARR